MNGVRLVLVPWHGLRAPPNVTPPQKYCRKKKKNRNLTNWYRYLFQGPSFWGPPAVSFQGGKGLFNHWLTRRTRKNPFDVRSLVVETKSERPSMEKTERKSWADMRLGGVGVYEVSQKKNPLVLLTWKFSAGKMGWTKNVVVFFLGGIHPFKYLRTMSV